MLHITQFSPWYEKLSPTQVLLQVQLFESAIQHIAHCTIWQIMKAIRCGRGSRFRLPAVSELSVLTSSESAAARIADFFTVVEPTPVKNQLRPVTFSLIQRFLGERLWKRYWTSSGKSKYLYFTIIKPICLIKSIIEFCTTWINSTDKVVTVTDFARKFAQDTMIEQNLFK